MNQKFRDLDESLIVKPIPKYLMERVKYYYERIGVSLADAVRYAIQDRACKNTIWYKMWQYDDYREIIPSEYRAEYLDLEKYPLKYEA